MFVNIVEFPPIKKGKEDEFKELFEWSNSIFSQFEGFISRRLLKVKGENRFAAIVEHESESTFMAMHLSEERKKVHEKLDPLFEGKLVPHFYEVIIG